jgi:hypothetical protein
MEENMVIKGLGKIQEESEKVREYSSKDSIRYIFLKNSHDIAIFRFLTDGDSVVSAQFHNVEEDTPKGKVWAKYYCPEQDEEPCKWHAEGSTTSEMIFAWAFWKSILHTTQNPLLETNPDAPQWVRGNFNGRAVYKEDLNIPAVYRTTVGKSGLYKKTLISYYNQYGTFLDRDYTLTREGKMKDTVYMLMPRDPSPMTEEIKSIISTLPDLALVISGKINSFTQSEEVSEEPKEEETKESKEEFVF